jgi:hypothetical protein
MPALGYGQMLTSSVHGNESLYSAVILLIYASLNDTFSISPYTELSYKVSGE